MRKKLTILFLALLIPTLVFAFTYDWEIDYMEYATDAAAQAAYVSSDVAAIQPASWDLLDENCSDISDWNDADIGNAVSEVSPAGQFRMDGNTAIGYNKAERNRDIGSIPNTFTIEVKLYHDLIGTLANIDYFYLRVYQADERLLLHFASDGLLIRDTDSGFTEVGTNLVKTGGSSEWQTWRFLVTSTETTGEGTCDVYLNDSTHDWEKVGTAIPCSYEAAATDGDVTLLQYGFATNDMLTHVDYIKIYDGLSVPTIIYQSYSESTRKTQGSYSLKGVAVITDSLDDTLTRTLSDNLDLSNSESIEYDIYALRTGSNIKIGIHDSGGTTSEHTANVATSNTNQTESWDISGVADANKDDIDSIVITISNADAANTFYLDDMKWGIDAAGGGNWTWVQ